jgi:hypothetical protein
LKTRSGSSASATRSSHSFAKSCPARRRRETGNHVCDRTQKSEIASWSCFPCKQAISRVWTRCGKGAKRWEKVRTFTRSAWRPRRDADPVPVGAVLSLLTSISCGNGLCRKRRGRQDTLALGLLDILLPPFIAFVTVIRASDAEAEPRERMAPYMDSKLDENEPQHDREQNNDE